AAECDPHPGRRRPLRGKGAGAACAGAAVGCGLHRIGSAADCLRVAFSGRGRGSGCPGTAEVPGRAREADPVGAGHDERVPQPEGRVLGVVAGSAARGHADLHARPQRPEEFAARSDAVRAGGGRRRQGTAGPCGGRLQDARLAGVQEGPRGLHQACDRGPGCRLRQPFQRHGRHHAGLHAAHGFDLCSHAADHEAVRRLGHRAEGVAGVRAVPVLQLGDGPASCGNLRGHRQRVHERGAGSEAVDGPVPADHRRGCRVRGGGGGAGAVAGPLLRVIGAVAEFAAVVAQQAAWLIVSIDSIILAMRLWTLAMWAFNAAMAANPITLILIAVIALVAIFVYAYNGFDWFREGVQTVWSAIQTGAMWLWNTALKPFFDWFGKIVSWLWTTIIKPYIGFLISYWKMVGSIALWLWDTILRPFFAGFGATV